MMKDDVCFVAVGQCGGNNGLLFERLGYDVFYINTAKDDVDTLKGAKHVYVTPGTRGCNQDANKAKAILSRYSEQIVDQIDKFATKRIVYFISGAGGGTSAMTPLLLELVMEHYADVEATAWDKYDADEAEGKKCTPPVHRKVGLITCLPSIAESAQINANAYSYVQEVVDLTLKSFGGEIDNMASVFLVDNENCSDKLTLNEKFVSVFDEMIQIPDMHHSMKGNVDSADLDKAFTAPGVCVVAKLTAGSGEAGMVDGIRHSSIFAATEDTSGMYWVSSTTNDFATLEVEKELGAPRAHFYTFNDEADYFLVSGMGFPTERLEIMGQRAHEFRHTASKLQRDLAASALRDDLSFMNEPLIVRTERRSERQSTVAVVGEEGNIELSREVVAPTEVTSAKSKLNKFKQRRSF